MFRSESDRNRGSGLTRWTWSKTVEAWAKQAREFPYYTHTWVGRRALFPQEIQQAWSLRWSGGVIHVDREKALDRAPNTVFNDADPMSARRYINALTIFQVEGSLTLSGRRRNRI